MTDLNIEMFKEMLNDIIVNNEPICLNTHLTYFMNNTNFMRKIGTPIFINDPSINKHITFCSGKYFNKYDIETYRSASGEDIIKFKRDADNKTKEDNSNMLYQSHYLGNNFSSKDGMIKIKILDTDCVFYSADHAINFIIFYILENYNFNKENIEKYKVLALPENAISNEKFIQYINTTNDRKSELNILNWVIFLVLCSKFNNKGILSTLLKATGNNCLLNINDDKYWGIMFKDNYINSYNILGIILMCVRYYIEKDYYPNKVNVCSHVGYVNRYNLLYFNYNSNNFTNHISNYKQYNYYDVCIGTIISFINDMDKDRGDANTNYITLITFDDKTDELKIALNKEININKNLIIYHTCFKAVIYNSNNKEIIVSSPDHNFNIKENVELYTRNALPINDSTDFTSLSEIISYLLNKIKVNDNNIHIYSKLYG